MRSLLIVIHGTESIAELSSTFRAFGDIGAGLVELTRLGLIGVREVGAQPPVANDAEIVPAPPAGQADVQ